MPVFELRRISGKSAWRAALACALCVTVVMAWTPARAGDDDGEDNGADVKFLRKFLDGIGLTRDTGTSIDYRERSPLVIPPSLSLPTPEKDAIAGNPNWPVDPEIKRDRQAKAAQRAKVNNGNRSEEDARVLRPDELDKGPRTASSRDGGAMSADESGRPFKPSALGYKGGLFSNMFGKNDEDVARFTNEPPRVSLTDPPAGYQTPSPDQPYGLGKEVSRPKAFDYTTERGTQKN